MPKFAANLTYLFKEYPFLERFEAAADAGFAGVEVLFPYDDPANAIQRSLRRAQLPLVLMNTPPPNWTGGERGFAAIPALKDRFRRDFQRSLRFAEALRPQHIHVMAGVAEGQQAHDTFTENLRWACDMAPNQSLTIEPLNSVDMPGYFLNDFAQANAIIAEVGAPNLGLQFDAYHAQILTGDAISCWDAHGRAARHIQVGSVPGRNEPDAGQIDFPAFFAELDAAGYDGFVSGEYNPKGRTLEGLGWIKGGA